MSCHVSCPVPDCSLHCLYCSPLTLRQRTDVNAALPLSPCRPANPPHPLAAPPPRPHATMRRGRTVIAALCALSCVLAAATCASAQPLDATDKLWAWVRRLGGMVGPHGGGARACAAASICVRVWVCALFKVGGGRSQPDLALAAFPCMGAKIKLEAKTNENGVRGIFATEHVKEGDFLASIPASTIINAGGTGQSFAVGWWARGEACCCAGRRQGWPGWWWGALPPPLCSNSPHRATSLRTCRVCRWRR